MHQLGAPRHATLLGWQSLWHWHSCVYYIYFNWKPRSEGELYVIDVSAGASNAIYFYFQAAPDKD